MFAKANDITLAIEQQLRLSGSTWQQMQEQYPWYPLAPLGRYLHEINDEKLLEHAALFINDPFRIHLLVNAPAVIEIPAALETPKSSNELAPALPTQMVVTTEENYPPATETQPEAPEPAEVETPMVAVNKAPAIEPEREAAAPVQQQEPAADTEGDLANPVPEGEKEDKIKLPAFSLKMPEESQSSDKFLFQPYHTVDYFASQGIKIESLGVTRFDNQLKSFTQWLKTMKRMNYETGKATDPTVDAQATASLQVKEVLTESMAEVLVKQGKADQAIAVYAKLTLLHPEKSVFFAAQIQKIKEEQ